MTRDFVKGDIVKNFKRETVSEEQLEKEPNIYLYEIIGSAKYTDTGEKLMLYKPLWDEEYSKEVNYIARPMDMFVSEVDYEKYPKIKQKYRFEKVED